MRPSHPFQAGLVAGGVLLLSLSACISDPPLSSDVFDPASIISDGAHSGNPHFFFLPPMLRAPVFSGTFDGSRSPVVRITEEGAPVVDLSASIPEGSEQYQAIWHTDAFNLDPAKTYRITVLVGGVVLGYADVDVVATGGQLKNVNTGEYIPLLDGRTLPIKFRIEVGAVLARGNLTAGDIHTCALVATGQAYCWGQNQEGQLGDGSMVNRNVPTAVLSGLSFVRVTAGGSHSCGLTASGEAFCWGMNQVGQLGDGTLAQRLTPVAVTGGHRFIEFAAFGSSTCGLEASGQAYCWGLNNVGQLGNGLLGDGTTEDGPTPAPVPVTSGLRFAHLATQGASAAMMCALIDSGEAYCWGQNSVGQLGDGTQTDRASPVAVIGGLQYGQITVGGEGACGLTSGGQAFCWGWNVFGELGDGTTTMRLSPVAVQGGLRYAEVSMAEDHTCGIALEGVAYCWGRNLFGALGDGTGFDRTVPTPVSGGLTFTTLAAGRHTCGLTSGSQAYCWGYNVQGQLGDGTEITRLAPVAVTGGLTF
jgi:alpha-tubulin suppressor-like RCC1 family protein